MPQLAALAELLDDAAGSSTAVAQLSATAQLSVADAYAIQRLSIDRRLARGEQLVGVKLGFTSRRKMIEMGIDDIVWGRLTDRMMIEDGGVIRLDSYVRPRVEPEIAFLLKRPLVGEVSMAEALAAIEAVAPAMELIDSRYRDFRFNLADVIADNCSAAGFVLGAWRPPDIDLSNLEVVLEFAGHPVKIGSSTAISGHPVRSLVNAARLAGNKDLVLEAGWIILAGAATEAEALRAGVHTRTVVEQLGTAEFTVQK
ncbi:MAG TPA: fumarylacetoacetate hydrolase family protein [Woeseiaceae bacterium]|nr:fumarylacetoacetate hydrolase family protein [Woeseiaceae bacterium]